MTTAIEKITKHAAKIASGKHEAVRPGMEFAITEAATVGDGVWQGDLGLEVASAVPPDYVQIKMPKSADAQLVPGQTQGARHCLDSLKGVTLYRPKDWSDESLRGPCFTTKKARKVLHPTHGAVLIPAGFTIICRYQREWYKEQQKARRAMD